MPKLNDYLDNSIVNRIGEKEREELKSCVINYYTLKEVELGKNEIELIVMLFDTELSVEEISRRTGVCARQIRRKREKYIDFFIKLVYRYFEEKDAKSDI